MNSRKTNSSRKLSFQTLEDRSLMTGNVSVSVQNHALVVNGDNQDNAIEIQQVGNGQFKVLATDGATKINGQSTPQTFSGITGDFKINLNGGTDVLSIDNFAKLVPQMILPGNLKVDLGSGNDVMYLDDLSVQGGVTINGGSGGKVLDFSTSHIGNPTFNAGQNDLNINLSGGSNMVEMSYITVERDLTIKSNVNNSNKSFMLLSGGTVGRNTLLQTGKGDDSFSTNEYYFGKKLQIQTSDGNDKVVLGGYDTNYIGTIYSPMTVSADEVYVDLGKGNDILAIGGKGSVIGGGVSTPSATYLGGDGVDQVVNGSAVDLFGNFSGFETMPHVASTKVTGKQKVSLAKI
ncbi:MAG TPA: hypothetical protein VGJ04_06190 [Pirellulales bacterium]|jgi:hypothetical protein